jgi:hypothetical protein
MGRLYGSNSQQGGGRLYPAASKVPTPAPGPSGLDFAGAVSPFASKPVLDFSVGAVKGAGDLAVNAAKLGEKVLQKTGVAKLFDLVFGAIPSPQRPAALEPTSAAQKAGYGAEKLAELTVPVGGAAGIVSAARKFGRAAELGAKALTSGADFAARTAVQSGGDVRKTAEAGAVGAVTPPILEGAGALIAKAAPKIGRTAAAIIGGMIGKEPEHVIRAFENPERVAGSMAKGVIPLDVRKKAISALGKFRQDYQKTFAKGLESTKKLYPYGKTGKILVEREVNDATKGIPAIMRDFRVSVVNRGQALDFDKLNSAIVSPAERNNIRVAYKTIRNQTDFSVRGVESVAERLSALQRYTEGAAPRTSAIIAKLHEAYDRAIATTYPELGKLRGQYRADSAIADEIDSVLRSVADKRASVPAVTSAVRKLSNIFNEDNEAYLRAIQKLEQVSGQDLLNQLTASEFRNVLPKSFGSRLGQAGVLAGGLFTNPLLLLALPLFSPRLEGKLITGAGRAAPAAAGVVSKAVEPAIRAATRAYQEQ